MRRALLLVVLSGLTANTARADGLLVPTDRSLPPLSLRSQRVNVTIDGQVATTSVEQVFHNSTSQNLEAEYLFPMPAGSSVREFAMWVNGQKLKGETLDARKARQTYEDIVRRLKDPGLLEYVDRDLWKVRIFPIPPQGDQRIEIKFTTLLQKQGDLVAYSYPLRTGQHAHKVTNDFTMIVKLRSVESLGSIYSPSHDVAVDRKGSHEAIVSFERSGVSLDRDFLLYFAPTSKDVGLSLIAQRPSHGDRGYFLLLLSPRAESQSESLPRDLVVVLDTSYSMRGEKLKQAKGALRSALRSLKSSDRFALVQFATVVTPFRDRLLSADEDNLDAARKWVDDLEAQGATDIGQALHDALELKPSRSGGRSFQVVFFTDGLPTAGLRSPEILKAVKDRDLDSVRIFTFGVGDDVDARLLDQIAEQTRGSSTYVRPDENIEAKSSVLVSKISHPVRTELKLRAGSDVRLVEMYPLQLPDLFRGEQLQVAGRYEGNGHVALTLESRVGDRLLSNTYEVSFPRASTDVDFVAPIWARRKVGYLLDQIRLHGESGELRDEVARLGREFGIATPYTSMLVVPDDRPVPLGLRLRENEQLYRHVPGQQTAPAPPAELSFGGASGPVTPRGAIGGGAPARAFEPQQQGQAGQSQRQNQNQSRSAGFSDSAAQTYELRGRQLSSSRTESTDLAGVPAQASPIAAESGKPAIELAQRLAELKQGDRVKDAPIVKTIQGRTLRQVGDVWVDDAYKAGPAALTIKPFGASYFRLLERHPELKAVLALGSRLVVMTPSGKALVVDDSGSDEVSDAELDSLFSAPK